MTKKPKNIVQTLQGWMKNRNTNFPQYIQYIQFPFYKNMEKDTRISFDFPLTVFVGQNGCGKSSVLHALYGCPAARSTGNYWFSTKLDPIEESRDDRPNSFFYGYYNEQAKRVVQCLKTRIKKPDNPDYWEPSRPITSYGMEAFAPELAKTPGASQTRWKLLRKPVLYLDFRSELSTFDQYFYFGQNPTNLKSIKTKQDRLRTNTNRDLVPLFSGDEKLRRRRQGSPPLNRPLHKLTDEEIKAINQIIGKSYDSGSLIEHHCFDLRRWGYSARFKTEKLQYSDAFAGSGEISIIRLVTQVMQAKEHSLIILDEPEVSLHPGAQTRVRDFLLEQVKKKRHQVIISTHAPAFVDGLPDEAIKVFAPNEEGTFRVQNSSPSRAAFNAIGHKTFERKAVLVEDIVAKLLLEEIAKTEESYNPENIEIIIPHGGAKDIWKDVLSHSRWAHLEFVGEYCRKTPENR